MSTYDNQTGRLPPQSMFHQRYLIVGHAGRGGMSAVYQAVDIRFGNRRVAIKELSQGHLSADELDGATARFQQEAALLGSLHHPNLPLIYDAFSENGRSYLVMEYIDGKTLLQMLNDSGGGALPVAQVLDYAIQLCDVLDYLHSQNPPIIFRDLKPTNVMVRENGHVVLIDFGIARFFKEGQAQDTVSLGSPGYAPPEQHGISQTNPRSDLYSLGATLHCCLTGRDPFRAADRFAFPPVRQMNPLVPLAFDQLIQRLVSIDERQRPTSALEVQQALLRIKQHATDETTGLDPVLASAPTQYTPPVPTSAPAPILSNPIAPTHLPTVPVSASSIPALSPAFGQIPPLASPTPQARVSSSLAAIWTMPFIILFGLVLAITIGGSTLALNIINYSDHVVEFSLSLLLFLVAIIAGIVVRGSFPRGILFLTGLAILIPGFAFVVQASPNLQSILTFNSSPTEGTSSNLLNLLLTIGLAATTIISLFWLIRPFVWITRIMLLVLFGTAAICTFLQYPYRDELLLQLNSSILGESLTQAINNEAVPKHILLVIILTVLILGLLIAAQTERVQRKKNS